MNRPPYRENFAAGAFLPTPTPPAPLPAWILLSPCSKEP